MPGTLDDQVLADQLLDKAIQNCADLKFQGDPKLVLQALKVGRCDICATVSECLVRQVGDYLGKVDKTVKAVYQYGPEYSFLRSKPENPTLSSSQVGINLVAWVGRKSAALSALGTTLESAISESRKRIHCASASPSCYTLDIQMIEDRDVQENRGFGMLVNHMFVRTSQIWQREEAQSRVAVGSLDEEARRMQVLLASFEPEFSPENTLLEQAAAIEKLSEADRRPYEHRIREIKVALIRRLISDQLTYINIAKEWFTIDDLSGIFRRKIGNGRIGGKAAGMILAARILNEVLEEPLRNCIQTPESFFLGSDLLYLFMAMNGLMHWNNQKYKTEDQIRSEYPQIREEFIAGEFPPEILCSLGELLEQIEHKPIIVRSSSLLEDNFGTSFAGKYESVFLPNQGSPQQNLQALTRAIARIYSSTLKPEALLYRRANGLQDYDERMAVLIQTVQGEQYGRYFFPQGAGVAFSHNLYRWSPQIRKEDGFVRLVWGLGTRAVERVGNDYPRLVALSHPTLHPDDTPEAIRYYSQQYIDLIDLQENKFKTLPVSQVMRPDYPGLRYFVQIDEDGYLSTPRGRIMTDDINKLAITYEDLLRRTPFAGLMTKILKTLEEHYHVPVDFEFTLRVVETDKTKPGVQISLLQCRPQSVLRGSLTAVLPKNLEPEQIIFTTCFMVPQGTVKNIRKVLFVTPEGYFQLPTQAVRNELSRVIAHLNKKLDQKSFICVGPGRWGTINPDLGVFVGYSDINNSAALVELSGKGIGPAPDPSLGTHFFQDLMEANIYPVAINLEDKGASFNRQFFYEIPNRIGQYIETSTAISECLRLIDVNDYAAGCHLDLIMDDDKGQAIAFCVPDETM
ncbi:MAG TPA: PEP/pyruvate-binding domain-containing protein [Anaerolineaceae bacterium]|nr:PEP/pyruvate-binding domain-containing protein [Anaerolineaceae bacterium]